MTSGLHKENKSENGICELMSQQEPRLTPWKDNTPRSHEYVRRGVYTVDWCGGADEMECGE